jgi:hypothetical protein
MVMRLVIEELAGRWQSDGRKADLLVRRSELANYLRFCMVG